MGGGAHKHTDTPKSVGTASWHLESKQANMMSKLLYGTALLIWQLLLCQLLVKSVLSFNALKWKKRLFPHRAQHAYSMSMHTVKRL